MENNIKFRNHFSVVIEKILRFLPRVVVFLLMILVAGSEPSEDMPIELTMGVIGGGVLVCVILLVWQIIIWARTYIYIQENTLIVEKNTLNAKKHTIGIASISNINLERNIFQMMTGTCRIKLDTNSLSTADQTDVQIVLKKKDAEAFRQMIFRLNGEEVEVSVDEENPEYAIDLGDIILHSIFSVSLVSVLVIGGLLIPELLGLLNDIELEPGEELPAFLQIGAFAMSAIVMVATLIGSMVKEFVKYLNFQINRSGDKIFLSYGLFKKVAYSIPVDKINGVCITQTIIARMFKRYAVEVINVGMDDDQNEQSSFFLPYTTKRNLEKQLHRLLPEFDGCLDIQEKRQPKAVWIIWGVTALVIFIGGFVGALIGLEFVGEETINIGLALVVALALMVLWLLLMTCGYFTKGIGVHEDLLKIVNGYMAREYTFLKYDKIQYVVGNQSWLAKQFGIQKGRITVLASMKRSTEALPFFSENDMETLKKHLVSKR